METQVIFTVMVMCDILANMKLEEGPIVDKSVSSKQFAQMKFRQMTLTI